MTTVPDPTPTLKPTVIAAVLLLALDLCRQLAVSAPRTVAQALSATGASRAQAYEMRRRLLNACASLPGRGGRPPRPAGPDDAVRAVHREVRDYLMDHPGAVSGRGKRRSHGKGFSTFVTGLPAPGAPGARLSIPELADATGVPLGTLNGWLVPPKPAHDTEPHVIEDDRQCADIAVHPHIATILTEYPQWDGNFVAFCSHLEEHHRLPYKRGFVNSVLVAARLRTPKRRGQPVMAPWSRDTRERFFPGAQWFGDGTELAIQVNGQRYVFNFQAVVDGATSAIVGTDVSDVENEDALLRAVHHRRVTTGQAPMALTVDGKPCNHTPLVQDSIAPTEVLPATPGRGQAKAPVEGAFGLFQRLEVAIASYSTEAILRAIALFDAKVSKGTVSAHADRGRYLAGIARNTDTRLELERTADELLQLRLRRRDLTLRPLEHALKTMRRTHHPHDLPKALVTAALDATAHIDVRFFTRAAAENLASLPEHTRRSLLPTLVRIVAAAFTATKRHRHDLIAVLTRAAADG